MSHRMTSKFDKFEKLTVECADDPSVTPEYFVFEPRGNADGAYLSTDSDALVVCMTVGDVRALRDACNMVLGGSES